MIPPPVPGPEPIIPVVVVSDAPPLPPLSRVCGESLEQALKCESKTSEIGKRQQVLGCMGAFYRNDRRQQCCFPPSRARSSRAAGSVRSRSNADASLTHATLERRW